MIALITAVAYSCLSCESEPECRTGWAEFINVNTGDTLNTQTDCEKESPQDGYVFVKWLDKPEY